MLLMLLMIIITCRLSPVPKHDNFPIIYHHTRVNNSSSTPSKNVLFPANTEHRGRIFCMVPCGDKTTIWTAMKRTQLMPRYSGSCLTNARHPWNCIGTAFNWIAISLFHHIHIHILSMFWWGHRAWNGQHIDLRNKITCKWCERIKYQ